MNITYIGLSFFGIDGTQSEGGFYDIQYYVGDYSLNPDWDTEPLNLSNPAIYIEALVGSSGGGGHGFGSGDDTPGTGILGGISSFFTNLFIPSQSDIDSFYNDISSHFESHLGFLYDGIDMLVTFIIKILDIDFSDKSFTLGPYTLPLSDDYVLVPLITYDLDDLLENELVASIHETYLLIVDGILFFGFILYLEKLYKEIVGDKNDN